MQQAAKDSPSSWPAECRTSYIIVDIVSSTSEVAWRKVCFTHKRVGLHDKMTCFRPRKFLLGVRTMGDVIWGKYSPKTPQKGAWVGSFKPKRQNLYIAISPELLIRLTIWGRNSDHERHFVSGPPLPQSKCNMADGRHLEHRYDVISTILTNGYDVIFPQWVLRFGPNSAAWCGMTRRLRKNGRDRNRK